MSETNRMLIKVFITTGLIYCYDRNEGEDTMGTVLEINSMIGDIVWGCNNVNFVGWNRNCFNFQIKIYSN